MSVAVFLRLIYVTLSVIPLSMVREVLHFRQYHSLATETGQLQCGIESKGHRPGCSILVWARWIMLVSTISFQHTIVNVKCEHTFVCFSCFYVLDTQNKITQIGRNMKQLNQGATSQLNTCILTNVVIERGTAYFYKRKILFP